MQGDFAHQGRGDEGVLLRRGQEDDLQLRHQTTIHGRQLRFIVEIGHAADAADQDGGAAVAGIVDQQAGKALDPDVRQLPAHLLGQRDALVQLEQRPFARAQGHGNHHLVKQTGGAGHQIVMSQGQRVEGSGKEGNLWHKSPAPLTGNEL